MSDPREYHWPADGLCVGSRDPLWDASIEGEPATERVARHKEAVAICRRCPVRLPCFRAVDPEKDDGVRGGVVLAALKSGRYYGSYGQVQGVVRKRRAS
jgi:hypothetical protein